jgi:anti-sigma B factor antagonist
MQIETRQADGVLILTPLEKRVDILVASAFRTAMIDRIDAGARRMIINLSHVESIDSSGLSALVSALTRIGRGGELRVCSLKPGVRSMFELTRLDRIISVLETEEDSVRSG